MSVLIKDMEKPKYCYAVIDGEVNQMKTNYLEKRTPQERLIIAKTLLETVLDDMPSAEKVQLSGEDATSVCKCPCVYREPCDVCHYDDYREHGCPAEEGMKDG